MLMVPNYFIIQFKPYILNWPQLNKEILTRPRNEWLLEVTQGRFTNGDYWCSFNLIAWPWSHSKRNGRTDFLNFHCFWHLGLAPWLNLTFWSITLFCLQWNLHKGHFFVLTDGPYMHFYFNLSTMAPSLQRQRPLKRVPTTEITSRQRPANQRLTKDVYKTPYWKRSQNLIRTARRLSLFQFGFCFFDIFCLRIYMLH